MQSAPLTTFVTAFLDLREDRSKDKSVERCFTLFDVVAATGIPFHVFLSKSYEALWASKLASKLQNVHVEWIEIEDLATYKEVQAVELITGAPLALPQQRTPHHDTRNFMILMNAKAELLGRAAAAVYNPQYAWIDFSIAHVFKNLEASLDYLNLLAYTRLRTPVIAFPGCWYRGAHYDNLFGGINWRFCGGFFIGDRGSILSFSHLYRREWPRALLEQRCLTWEVNFWHWLECPDNSPFRPHWYAANHDDSIIRIPQTLFQVVGSLTTIPPRLADGSCKAALDSLLHQVDKIYLSIPLSYGRFPDQEVEIPAWLSEAPYSSRVVVTRPQKDLGPATKYLGGLTAIPAGSWIFVCDDDQEYHPQLIQKMSSAIHSLSLVQNHLAHIKAKTSGGLVHGYVGLLVPRAALEGISSYPLPPAARFVDDQWMSIYCNKSNIPVIGSGVEIYSDIFAVMEGGWHEKLGAASLSSLSNRDEKVAELAAALGVRFLPSGAIEDV